MLNFCQKKIDFLADPKNDVYIHDDISSSSRVDRKNAATKRAVTFGG